MDQKFLNKEELKKFLATFPIISADKIEQLTKVIPTISIKKGTYLLKEGEVPKACYYVLKGLVRQFQIVDGNEKTTAFYSEKHAAVSSKHFIDQTKSTFYLVCSEDCLLIKGELGSEVEHYTQFPELMEVTKVMLEDDLNQTKENLSDFITSSPKDRYLTFLKKRSELQNRVPLHQVASFLGMTAESLSRIRKRIVSTD